MTGQEICDLCGEFCHNKNEKGVCWKCNEKYDVDEEFADMDERFERELDEGEFKQFLQNQNNINKEIFEAGYCKCGTPIPRGYGYTLGKPFKCFFCGRINQKRSKK